MAKKKPKPKWNGQPVRKSPLGSHLLLAKVWAGWYGVLCDSRAEKEEVRLINEKLKQKAAKAKENEEEEKRRLAYYPELAPKSNQNAKQQRRASLKEARSAETQQRRASQLPIAYNQEVELIQRLVEGSAEEKGQKAEAMRRRSTRVAGAPVPATFYDDEDDDDELPAAARSDGFVAPSPQQKPTPSAVMRANAPAAASRTDEQQGLLGSLFSDLFGASKADNTETATPAAAAPANAPAAPAEEEPLERASVALRRVSEGYMSIDAVLQTQMRAKELSMPGPLDDSFVRRIQEENNALLGLGVPADASNESGGAEAGAADGSAFKSKRGGPKKQATFKTEGGGGAGGRGARDDEFFMEANGREAWMSTRDGPGRSSRRSVVGSPAAPPTE